MMMNRRDKYYLVDSGFWFALISPDDEESRKSRAIELHQKIKHKNIVFPWPTYYEILRDRCFKKTFSIEKFKIAIRGLKINVIDDEKYKKLALDITLKESNPYNKISLVDNIIRLIIEDKDVQTDVLVTFNKSDFERTCLKNNMTILE